MAEQQIVSNTSFWMWLFSGASAIISGLIGLVLYLVKADISEYKQEVKGDFIKNDHDHEAMWKLHKEANETREVKCISRIEYEKDIKHTAEAILEMKSFTKEVNENMKSLNDLMLKHMARDNR